MSRIVTKLHPIIAIALLAATASLPVARAQDREPPLPRALEATLTESHEALRRILNGDPSGYAALFADRTDITLGNPFGPFASGRAAVLAALNNAATKYHDGSVVGVDRVASYGGGSTFIIVEVEHDRARLGNRPDVAEFAARVTSVYQLIGRQWRLVHRHADPITTARPAESMLGGGAAATPAPGSTPERIGTEIDRAPPSASRGIATPIGMIAPPFYSDDASTRPVSPRHIPEEMMR